LGQPAGLDDLLDFAGQIVANAGQLGEIFSFCQHVVHILG
jgi:hypothetical protein